jgi:chromosomal replication initiator protein DnaA
MTPPRADARYRFDNFVVGAGNRLAVAAARAVAESPGATYNPLFIYSGSGLGKTHLVGALGHLALELQPELKIIYLSLDEFVEQLHASISAGETDALKRRYHTVDLLILDDVQFLTGQRETQSEMLRLFTALQGSGRQVVMTSDRPPSEIADVDERLLTRLAGGLIVDIGAPDYETRIAILKSKCEERGLHFRPGVVEELARIEFANVRELQGALNRVSAFQALGQHAIGAPDVRAIVGITGTKSISLPSVPAVRNEFEGFIADVATVVAQHVEGWKARLGEAIAYWTGEGYRTAMLDRALQQTSDPDVERLVASFAATVEHLRVLEQRASSVDPALGANDVFRDPERVAEAEQLAERALAGHTPPVGPSPAFARDSFEVGASNEMAVRVADMVIADPGRKYNPLVIHGPSGVGKTHLANAIGNEMLNLSGGAMTVSCVGAQTFIDELVAAIQEGTLERWRARYRAADALIIDDVHFVGGKEKTQDELFHIFNAFSDGGRQIILTSDKPPRELGDLEERLRSRFDGGLVVAIGHPDRALREKLFVRYFVQRGIDAEADVVEYLADRQAASVREIIGTVHRICAAAELAADAVTLSFVRAELEGAAAAPLPAPVASEQGSDAFFLDDEKVVWDWPDVTARLIEEVR